nr:hypothetical protein [Bacteroides finegoldii]
MRYTLRNQDKIAAAYSSEYLKEHIIGSLDSYFNVPRSQEEVEDFIYSSCVCYSTNQGNYPIMQINDIADDNAMLEFAWIGTQYDVIKLAFLGRRKDKPMKNVTKLAKKSAGLSQKCSICPLMKRCTLEIQRACFDSFVEGFKKGARAAEKEKTRKRNEHRTIGC